MEALSQIPKTNYSLAQGGEDRAQDSGFCSRLVGWDCLQLFGAKVIGIFLQFLVDACWSDFCTSAHNIYRYQCFDRFVGLIARWTFRRNEQLSSQSKHRGYMHSKCNLHTYHRGSSATGHDYSVLHPGWRCCEYPTN